MRGIASRRRPAAMLLCRLAPPAGLVTPRQTFVRRRQNGVARAAAASATGSASARLRVPGDARDARSCGPSANAITAALAPAGRTPTVLGDSGRRLVGARYAVATARHPPHGAPLAWLSRAVVAGTAARWRASAA